MAAKCPGTGRHQCAKAKTCGTYDPRWSGVTYAPRMKGLKCPRCGGCVHDEDENAYCPTCDDYVKPV